MRGKYCCVDNCDKAEEGEHDTCSFVSPMMGARLSVPNPNKGAVKADDGKPDLSHISLELVELVARVRMFGAKKYARNNWKKGFKQTRSLAAALRHIFTYLGGEDHDPESGLSHLGHAVCCLEHAIYDSVHHPDNDDRRE